jgi:hypothetical protein
MVGRQTLSEDHWRPVPQTLGLLVIHLPVAPTSCITFHNRFDSAHGGPRKCPSREFGKS